MAAEHEKNYMSRRIAGVLRSKSHVTERRGFGGRYPILMVLLRKRLIFALFDANAYPTKHEQHLQQTH